MTPLKETWLNPKVEIRATKNKGKGMFAVEKIFAGEEIIIWGGCMPIKKKLKKQAIVIN